MACSRSVCNTSASLSSPKSWQWQWNSSSTSRIISHWPWSVSCNYLQRWMENFWFLPRRLHFVFRMCSPFFLGKGKLILIMFHKRSRIWWVISFVSLNLHGCSIWVLESFTFSWFERILHVSFNKDLPSYLHKVYTLFTETVKRPQMMLWAWILLFPTVKPLLNAWNIAL